MTTAKRSIDIEHRAYEQLRDQQQSYEGRALDLTTRVATWLLVANAAMLVLFFQSIVQHQIINAPAVLPIARWFAFGLFAAFAGQCYVLASLVRNGQLAMTKLAAGVSYDFAKQEIDEALARGTPLPDDAPARKTLQAAFETRDAVVKIAPRLWRYTAIAWVMLAVSAIATASGVITPLTSPEIMSALSQRTPLMTDTEHGAPSK